MLGSVSDTVQMKTWGIGSFFPKCFEEFAIDSIQYLRPGREPTLIISKLRSQRQADEF